MRSLFEVGTGFIIETDYIKYEIRDISRYCNLDQNYTSYYCHSELG